MKIKSSTLLRFFAIGVILVLIAGYIAVFSGLMSGKITRNPFIFDNGKYELPRGSDWHYR